MTNEQKYWIVTVVLILLMWGVSFTERTHSVHGHPDPVIIKFTPEHEPLS